MLHTPKIVIESPHAGDVAKNQEYLGRALRDCLNRGESPYASHALFTHYLDDNMPEERKAGINAGLVWGGCADKVVYYMDLGMSAGMLYALEKHTQANRIISVRLMAQQEYLKFEYTNHRGEFAVRKARFNRFYWGRTKWHPRDQVLMDALCLDRQEMRQFAVSDCKFLPTF